jgi:hypothetical protein
VLASVAEPSNQSGLGSFNLCRGEPNKSGLVSFNLCRGWGGLKVIRVQSIFVYSILASWSPTVTVTLQEEIRRTVLRGDDGSTKPKTQVHQMGRQ